MANKFEMGSTEFAIPTKAKEHYSEEEFEAKQAMYDTIEYEEGIDPSEYESKKVITDEAKALIEMRKERQKADKKFGHKLTALFAR